MHQKLCRQSGRRTVVVHGLGGMGKTQLAIAYMKRHRNDYSASIWLNARDEISLSQSFRNAAARILREHPDLGYMQTAVSDKDGDTSLAVRRWLDEPTNERWLLIYDNYDHPKMGGDAGDAPAGDGGNSDRHGEPDHPAPEGYDIRQHLPDTDHGAVIVTTRSSIVQIGELLRLRKLHRTEDSLRILESTSSRTGAQDGTWLFPTSLNTHAHDKFLLMTDAAAVALARKLDGLPLALSMAGTYLSQVSTSWQQYLQDYENAWGQLQKLSPQLLTYENRALYSTWNISFASIRRQSESAAMLLRLWAFFSNEDLWYELLRRGTKNGPKWLQDLTETRLAFDHSMRVLCSHGLVEAHPTTALNGSESSGYSVHACVHAWMIHVLAGPNEQVLAALAMECTSRHVPGEEIPAYWLIQRRLLLHADRCRQLLGEAHNDGSSAWMSGTLGNLYVGQGRPKEAEAMYKRALEGYEKARGPEHTSTLPAVNNLGILYRDQGRYKEAEAMYKRALEGCEKAWGPEHTSTLDTVNNLGALYIVQGRYKEAEAIYKRALEGKEKTWGPEHTSTLKTVNNLAILYKKQGRFEVAEAMYKRALEGWEKAWGPEHTLTLMIVSNIGNLYIKQGQYKEAEVMYRRALEGYEKVLGKDAVVTFVPFLNAVTTLGFLNAKLEQSPTSEGVVHDSSDGCSKGLW